MKFTSMMMAAALSILPATAFAQIVWDQDQPPRTAPAATPVYKQAPAPADSTFGTYHENINFEGNASLKKDDIKKLQKALASRGFYKGKIDGLWGGQTSQAILDFQGATNQPLTGTVTFGTLQDLGVKVDRSRY